MYIDKRDKYLQSKAANDISVYTDRLRPMMWEFLDYQDGGCWDGYKFFENTDDIDIPLLWKIWDATGMRIMTQFMETFMRYVIPGDLVMFADYTTGIVLEVIKNSIGLPLCYKIKQFTDAYCSPESVQIDYFTVLEIIWWSGWIDHRDELKDEKREKEGYVIPPYGESYDDTITDWNQSRRMRDEWFKDWYLEKKENETNEEFVQRYPYIKSTKSDYRSTTGDESVDNILEWREWTEMVNII